MDVRYLDEAEKFLIRKGLEALSEKFMSSAVESDSINLMRMVQVCEDLSKKISSQKKEPINEGTNR